MHLQDEQKRRGISASCEHYCMSMRDGSGVHLQLSRLGLASLESGGLARGGFGLLFQRALRRRELLGRLLRLRLPRLLGLGVLNLNLDLDLDLDLNLDLNLDLDSDLDLDLGAGSRWNWELGAEL
jgi:hypothetical protein